MRMKFGDYRSKMESDEKNAKLAEPKFTAKKGVKPDAKVFKRRVVLSSAGSTTGGGPQKTKCDSSSGASQGDPPSSSSSAPGGFKFNFNVSSEGSETIKSQVNQPDSNVAFTRVTSGPYKSFHFQKSDNSFKFNFSGT